MTQRAQQVSFHVGTPIGLKLFGLAFAAIPSFMMVMMIYDVFHGGDRSLLLVALFPLLFLVISSFLIAGRHGVTVDFAGQRIRRWKGVGPLLVGGWKTFTGTVAAVEIDYNERTVRSKNGSRIVREWPVRLTGISDELALTAPQDYLAARGFGESLARQACCDLADRGMGEERRRTCDELDVPLSSRLRELPDLPPATDGEADGITMTCTDRHLEAKIRPPGMNALVAAVPFAGVVFSIIVLIGFSSEIFGAETPLFFRLFALCFALGPAVVSITVGLRFMRMSTTAELLTVDNRGLRWQQGSASKTMAIDKLEELILIDRGGTSNAMISQSGVGAVSDEQMIRIGAGLGETGRKRLYAALLQTLQQLGRG